MDDERLTLPKKLNCGIAGDLWLVFSQLAYEGEKEPELAYQFKQFGEQA
jgi:hypothetical protein